MFSPISAFICQQKKRSIVVEALIILETLREGHLMATTKKQTEIQQVKQEDPKETPVVDQQEEEERPSYFDMLVDLEGDRFEYHAYRRPLVLYCNAMLVTVLVFVACLITCWLLGNNNFFTGWIVFVAVVAAIVFLVLSINLFTTDGFHALRRIKELTKLKLKIEQMEVVIRILQQQQETRLTVEEKTELYKDTLRQVIQEYQRNANFNRWTYFIIQMLIIACSLLVGGLTSGLNISIFGNHLLAPILSFVVSFLTAVITLFRPRERGFNLQQTADAIQYEIDCSSKKIYGYKGLTNEERFIRLSEEVERLRNEQRKRQQQLEQASDARQPNT
jgi:DNA-binding transcriptional MerR regulator